MSTKRYFEILGIPPTKNENLVKRAYRRKAMKYHPDRNPSAAAKDKFIEVSNAYDKIIFALEEAKSQKHSTHNATRQSTNSKYPYQQRQQSKTRTQNNSTEERNERVKRARERYEQMKHEEVLENERYYQNITSGKNWRRFKLIMFACTIISTLIILDSSFFSTQTIQSAIINKDLSPNYGRNPNVNSLEVEFENGQTAWIARSFLSLTINNYTYLERTPFFKDIKYLKVYTHDKWFYYTPKFSQSSSYPLIPLALLIPLFTFFIKAQTIYFSVLYHLSVKVMPIFLLIFLFSNDRWAHLLTLGLMG
ncbi:J domain-containing protein [Brumimicrobium oceani]|uniref:J domain-containing protein n=1 Tax=Brumimicrobium oceani TaxID=2100725 RepID=A0A2U2XEM5_9FLAO|nr:DnaJ domain-containing protein [Brumimicrobium oceani]PWH86197.1 hypothetical protein DIT68_06480 [Brumimicrobium oceani]